MMQVEVLTCVNLPSRNGDILWHVSPAARKKTCIRLSGWVYQCMCVGLSVSLCVRMCTCVHAGRCLYVCVHSYNYVLTCGYL